MEVKNNITIIRENGGYTVEQMAEALGITVQAIYKAEKENKLYKKDKLAKLLGYPCVQALEEDVQIDKKYLDAVADLFLLDRMTTRRLTEEELKFEQMYCKLATYFTSQDSLREINSKEDWEDMESNLLEAEKKLENMLIFEHKTLNTDLTLLSVNFKKDKEAYTFLVSRENKDLKLIGSSRKNKDIYRNLEAQGLLSNSEIVERAIKAQAELTALNILIDKNRI